MASANFKGFKIKIPFLGLEGTWEVDDVQRKAAWEIYVELVTRVTVVELKEGEGIIREALSSFYSLFNSTREVLKKYGPAIAAASNPGDMTLGHVATKVLNQELRPLLAKWHPKLQEYEGKRPNGISISAYERQWEHASQLREEIESVRQKLIEYANALAEVSEVSKLH